jgi:hypothetical protein
MRCFCLLTIVPRRTRTLLPDKPGLMNDDDQEMSSGDESDDEDLTDSDSSYSDRSESRAGEDLSLIFRAAHMLI